MTTNQWLSYDAWDNYFLMIYVQLLPGSDFQKSSEMVKDAMLTHVDAETAKTRPNFFCIL